MTSADSPGTGDSLLLPPALRGLGIERDTPPNAQVWRELVAQLGSFVVADTDPTPERATADQATADQITAHRPAETAAEQRAFYEHILDSVPLEIVVFSPEQRYLYVNPGAIRDDGVRAWIIGKNDFEYCAYRGLDRAVAENRRARFERALARRGPVELEERFVTASGSVKHFWRNLSPVYGPDGELQFVLGYGHDVTDLKGAQLELRRAHDELEVRVRERTEELHAATVRLELVTVGERLRGCVRPADTVARLGGDEFTVLLEDAPLEVATGAAERIEAAFCEPVVLADERTIVTFSIGVVASTGLYAHPDEVLRDADLAMYRAKAGGGARHEVFVPE